MHHWLHHCPKTKEGEEACVMAYYTVRKGSSLIPASKQGWKPSRRFDQMHSSGRRRPEPEGQAIFAPKKARARRPGHLRPEEGQNIWSKRRQGFQPCFEAGIRENYPFSWLSQLRSPHFIYYKLLTKACQVFKYKVEQDVYLLHIHRK